MSVDRDRLARIILSGINDIEEWRLGDPERAAALGFPRSFDAEIIDDWGIVFVDITVDARTGDVVCHEVNGSNAVGSDALTGESSLRADNEASQALRRLREQGLLGADGIMAAQAVAIHAHQHWPFFRTGGEFYPRVARFADCLAERLPGNRVGCHAAGDPLGNEDLCVIVGDVPAIAARLAYDPDRRRFLVEGRPAVFIGNPNILPEMARTGKFDLADRHSDNPALRVFPAWKLADLIHDKGRQQDLFAHTAIRPLASFSAPDIDEAVTQTRELLARGPVVIKPSNTSGGAGVDVVVAEMSDDDIRSRFERMLADCRAKYGEDAERMIFPLCGFEFVRSTGYAMDDGEHLWDLRIAVQFEPGKALAYPVSLRLTPEPFDAATFHLDRRQWISNVSGGRHRLLISGMDMDVLNAVGLDEDKLDRAIAACVVWTSKAWDCISRDGGKAGAVYEDFCDEADAPFYNPERFIL